ncbi:MAG: phage tail assembly chaperone [Sulfuricella sp.]
MLEFQIGGKEYRAQKLDAFEQLHVSRKIAPLLPALIPIFVNIIKDKKSALTDLASLAELIAPFTEGLADMSNEASEYVVSTCLSAIQRKQGDNWTPVWSKSGKCSMFDDVDMSSMIPMIIKVIQDSLGPFIRGMLTSQFAETDSTA